MLENKGLVLENIFSGGGGIFIFSGGVAIVLKHMLENKGLVLENIFFWGVLFFGGVVLVLKHILENNVFVLVFLAGSLLFSNIC